MGKTNCFSNQLLNFSEIHLFSDPKIETFDNENKKNSETLLLKLNKLKPSVPSFIKVKITTDLNTKSFIKNIYKKNIEYL
jgi:hypothetical protein